MSDAPFEPLPDRPVHQQGQPVVDPDSPWAKASDMLAEGFALTPAPLGETVLFTIPPTAVPNGVLQTMPINDGWLQVPATLPYSWLMIDVNLQLADKLAAVGQNNVMLAVYLSLDGTDATAQWKAGTNWTSYGSFGVPANPRHNTGANPDPTINFPIGPFLGNYIQIQTEFNGEITQAGETISGS